MKASVIVLLFLSLFGLNVSVYRYHFLVNETLSFQEAQKHCTQHSDYLSTVRSKDLQDLSSNSLIKEDYFWIGVQRDSADYYKWIWSEGGEATITFWAYGQPYYYYCGAVHKNTLTLFALPCKTHLRFYCMKVYELIVVHQKSTWEEALEYCRQNYIDLAIINSEDIMEEAKINSTVADTDEMWTGLRFLAGHWFWVNGAGFDYNVWSSGGEIQCPAMNQRCGVFDRTQGVCKPTDCERRLNFLCIKEKYAD
ncbi:secretory phospholipase A2 receptor-like [Sinocyclocheilus anshuiensis]|uniref:Secretory phospholipase A2 receptor-like n=1 Tax=Sinocyclocheilus anshuiensis TaxID=1608454 RepID=A0A671ND57_9TELE|nr:PREDICTED: secretory phospholipase A2 receptor-like [Sinocyclocheilus anshuiensis]